MKELIKQDKREGEGNIEMGHLSSEIQQSKVRCHTATRGNNFQGKRDLETRKAIWNDSDLIVVS